MARRTPSPEDVAAGAGNPGVAELMALVHRANPTDRGCDLAEQERRYALKSKLQSRLVREWHDHLDFRIEDGEAAVVSIVHRGHRRDAAHALLAALDSDARAIIHASLGMEEEAADEGFRQDTARRSASDPLSRGRAALEEWDFDTARSCFEEALAHSRGEPAAHALLDLLVERLGLDGVALAVQVPDRAWSVRVARLVAIAGARMGDARRARSLLERLDPPAEAEVRVLLAGGAVRAGDVAAARSHLDAIRALDPANGALLRVEDQLRALEGQTRAPLESALAAALETGDDDLVRRAAGALVDADPRSNAARAALAAIERRERARQAASHVQAAESLVAGGRLELAITELDRAVELGADVRDRRRTLRSELARARERGAVSDAIRSLDDGDLRPYASLNSEQRARMRGERPDRRLALIDRLIDERVREPVEAIAALERARGLAAERPERALAVLEHAHLAGAPVAREVEEEARDALAATRRRAAVEAARLLDEALGLDDDERASEVAETLQIDDLPQGERGRLDDLVEALQARRLDARAVERFDDLVRKGGVFQARSIAEAQLARSPDDPRWEWRLSRLEQRICRILPNGVVPAWSDDLRGVHPPSGQLSADACLEPDGRHAWLAEARAHLCFVRRIEVATSRAVSCTLVRTIEPFTRPRVGLFGNKLVLAARGCRFLVLEMGEGGRVSRVLGYLGDMAREWRPEYVDPGRDPHGCFLIRDVADGPSNPRYLTFDDANYELREVTGLNSMHAVRLPGQDNAFVQHQPDGQVRVVRGPRFKAERVGWALRVDAVVPSLTGNGIVCVGAFPPGIGTELAVALLDSPDASVPRRRVGLPGATAGSHPVARSREHGLLYVLVGSQAGNRQLVALDHRLDIPWKVRLPGLVHLLTDADDVHAAVVFATSRGPVVVPLGSEPPEAPPGTVEDARVSDDELRQVIATADAIGEPAGRFEALDHQEVWQAAELQTMARLAESALVWDDCPWPRRTHACAAFYDAIMRYEQNDESGNLSDVAGARTPEQLAALKERVDVWLLECLERELDFLRVGPDNPLWPSTANIEAP